mmetsp:Transcript_54566/g.118987  ORF Transcript_54566/g.118987 Transcript_54566/m.118987 type:complete len:320 (+) Transcript_54566:293-1252(+)
MMRLRIRAPSGALTAKFDEGATFADLLDHIAQATGDNAAKIMAGFPPTEVVYTPDMMLSTHLASGDTITIHHASTRPSTTQQQPQDSLVRQKGAPTPTATEERERELGVPVVGQEAMVRRVIPADNSCLFNAVSYALEGGVARAKGRADALRSLVAEAVLNNPTEYNEAILGRTPEDYAVWIKDPSHWGGGIELSVLSDHFGAELCAFDIQTCRVDVFGQGKGHSSRALLMYDGIHYDVLAKQVFDGAPQELDVTVFDTADEGAMNLAARVVKAAHDARDFTDTGSFTLRCLVCQKGLVGEKDALAHAQETCHANFSEY